MSRPESCLSRYDMSRSRARYCEYTVANAPKMLRMRLNKLHWSHCATWINVRFPPAICSFLLVPRVVRLVLPHDSERSISQLVKSCLLRLTAMFTMAIIQYTTSQFRSAHAHARSRADLLRSTRITSTSLNMHVMLAYASELRGCSSVAST